jgi:TRAP-type uncharacterized transport system substrate-binding protein
MAKLPRHLRPQPVTIRSRVVLEIAAELVAMQDQPNAQAKVLLRPQGESGWPLALSGSSTIAGVHEVVNGEAALAIVNPSSALTVAYRGNAPFTAPQPVLPIAVIPSLDLCLFVVSSDTGLTYIEDIAEQKFPLRIALRGQSDHWLQQTFNDICAAAGFTMEDLKSWGGEDIREGGIPSASGPKFAAMASGEINAIFDESAFNWGNDTIPAGMTVLNMKEETIQKLETIGHKRAYARKEQFPNFPGDITTVDFSGWPVFVHADASDELVTQICTAFEARKHLIPWQYEGPLPLERMSRDCEDAPLTVPLHPAAERFWKKCGYLD